MQISNLETVFESQGILYTLFESEQILCTAHAQKCEIFQKIEFFHDHEELDIDNGLLLCSVTV